MSSTPAKLSRRVPQQQRGELRMAKILEAAANVIAVAGYEAATMTAIAERAQASIGTVYEYFPNKEAVARALRLQYGDEIEERWKHLDGRAKDLSVDELVEQIIDITVQFMNDRPAYIPLISANVNFKRDPAARLRFRERLASFFVAKRPGLSDTAALRTANIMVQTVKGLSRLYAEARPKDRAELVREYKQLLRSYLRDRLASEP
jgi:AcrR family transcriptional regulator